MTIRDTYPGVLRAAMTDAAVIDAGGDPGRPLMARWGEEWGEIIRSAAEARASPATPTMPASSDRRWRAHCIRLPGKARADSNAAWRWPTTSPAFWFGRFGPIDR